MRFVWFWPLFEDALILCVVVMHVSCGNARCSCDEMSGRQGSSIVSSIQLLILVLFYIHERWRKFPSSHEDLAPNLVSGWKIFLLQVAGM